MSIIVFIPMYNCASQIGRVLAQFDAPLLRKHIDAVVCIDNRSTDGTADAAAAALSELNLSRRTLLRNSDNYGLGGSHKVAIDHAMREGFDYIVVLHGDDQGNIADLIPYLEAGRHMQVDFLMGARFMSGSKLVGYSALRTWANHAFNLIFSTICRHRLYDLGSGLNVFRVAAFEDRFHYHFADDLTFNYYLIIGVVDRGFKVSFFPVTWREDDQISNAKLGHMGVQILRLLWARATNRKGFTVGEHRVILRETYSSDVLGDWRT